MIQDTENSALTEQIAAFKSDPEKLREATEFVDQLIQQAKKEAELKQKEKDRSKFESQDAGSDFWNTNIRALIKQGLFVARLKYETRVPDMTSLDCNLKRRLGRARGFVLRMFDALCNCTQTAAAAARTTARNNPFTKR